MALFLTAAAFVVAVIPYILTGCARGLNWMTMRSFWDGKSKNYVIQYPVQRDESSPSKEWRLVKHETVSAARRLESFLKGHGCKVTLKRSSDELTDEDKQANVVFVGSSRTNPTPCKLVPNLERHFGFGVEQESYFIKDKDNALNFPSPMDNGGSADFALIVKVRNPYSPDRSNRVYYLAGIHAVGCWAAAEYLTDQKTLRRLNRYRPGPEFSLEAIS